MSASSAFEGALGEHFARHADSSPYNAYIDRPAMLGLAGDVDGLDVLDVGCGAGHYAVELLARGARVTGIDGSADLLEHARRVTSGRARFHRHDLERPLGFVDDESFDLVVLALVYHHVHARAALLAELRRVLRPGGRLLVSTTHPSAELTWFGGSYFANERVDAQVAGGRFEINYQRMTMEAFLTELLEAGFVLERLVEPRPVEQFREVDPQRYAELSDVPTLVAVSLRLP